MTWLMENNSQRIHKRIEHSAGLVVNYGISRTIVLDIPQFTTKTEVQCMCTISGPGYWRGLCLLAMLLGISLGQV